MEISLCLTQLTVLIKHIYGLLKVYPSGAIHFSFRVTSGSTGAGTEVSASDKNQILMQDLQW